MLPTMNGGGACHCTLLAGKTSSPVLHKSVEEIWYVLEGQGEVWRKVLSPEEGSEEGIVSIKPSCCLTIPPRTAFQFRNTGPEPLRILIVTMPPWPGSQEAEDAHRIWSASMNAPPEISGK